MENPGKKNAKFRRLLTNALRQVGSYVSCYGATGMLWFFFDRVKFSASRHSQVQLTYRRTNQKVTLRTKSSDFHTYYQVFIDDDYRLNGGRVLEALADGYNRILSRGRVPLIVDGGANIGLAAKRFSDVFPKAIVIAVEPDRGNYEVAKTNCAGTSAVRLVNAALWDQRTTLHLQNPDADAWAYRFDAREGEDQGIDALTIDELVASEPSAELMLIKLDIEGAERQVLRTSERWWFDAPVLIVEPHDWLPDVGNCLGGIFGRPTYQQFDVLIVGENLAFVPPSNA